MLHGNDVSGFQPGWYPSSGDGFAFVKCTQGNWYFNRSYAAQVSRTRAKHIPVGHYLYLEGSAPAQQGAWFHSHAQVQPGDFIAVDWEGSPPPSQAVKDGTIRELQRLFPTTKVGLYVNRGMWANSNHFYGDFLWIASPGVTPASSIPWTFWQYDWNVIDKNWARFSSVAALRAWATKGNLPPLAGGKQWLKEYGVWGCGCMALTLPHIQADMIQAGVVKKSLTELQGAYHAGALSGGTHLGGGVNDTAEGGAARSKAQQIWASWGVIDFERFPPLFPQHHNHLLWLGCPHQSPAAAAQVSGLVHHGWNGLSGSAARWGDYSLLPRVTWQQAYLAKAGPTPTTKGGVFGVSKHIGPLRAAGKKTALKSGAETYVAIDPDGGAAVADVPVTDSLIIRALVEISGLQSGEDVAVRWVATTWPHNKPLRTPRAVSFGNGRHEITYVGIVPAAPKGEQNRLRIAAFSKGKSASIQVLEVDGRAE